MVSTDLVHGPALWRVLIEATLHGKGGKDVGFAEVAVRPARLVWRPCPANCAVIIVQTWTPYSSLGPRALLGSLQLVIDIMVIKDCLFATPGLSGSRTTRSPRGRQTDCPNLCCGEPEQSDEG